MATFAWEFSQSSYPHLTSTFLILLSCWLAWGAWLEKYDSPVVLPQWLHRGDGRYALAGMVFAVAVGVRLDSAFAGLALAIPLIYGGTIRWRPAFAMAIGAAPAFAGLAWINLIKFGAFSPLTYGHVQGPGVFTGSIAPYIPVTVGLVAVLALYLMQTRRRFEIARWHVTVLLLVVAAGLLLTPLGQKLLNGVFQIVVDMRIRPDISEPALSRSPGNAVVYFENVKKALVESAPFLVLILLPAVSGLLRGSYGIRWLLWLAPIGFIGFYGFLAWHGSIGLNMR